MAIHPPRPLSGRLWRLAVAAAFSGLTFAAAGQDTRQTQIVVPYGPGVGVDALGRAFAEALRTQADRAAIVVNRGGSGGVIGTAFVARAPADGQTVLLHAHPPFGTATLFMKQPAYDPRDGLVPVAKVGEVPMVLVTSARNGIETFEQLKAHATANPGRAKVAGQPDFRATIAYAFFAPGGTSPETVRALADDLAKAYAAPTVRSWLQNNGVEGTLQGPTEFTRWLHADLDGIAKIVEAAKLVNSDTLK